VLELKTWCKTIEDSAQEQLENVRSHPLLTSHVAVMPDCHCGYGVPIGCVIAADGGVIPNAVGVDIGCGMAAIKTDIKREELSDDIVKAIMGEIRCRVPVGMVHHKEPVKEDRMPRSLKENLTVVKAESYSARKQLGTLGGGNHFIEFQSDEDGMVWMMVHSGSRNLGYRVANHYNKLAEEQCKRFKYDHLIKQGLAFLPCGTKEYEQYLSEMEYCMDFARCNRETILVSCVKALAGSANFVITRRVDIHHNYAALENHYGRNWMIHRKGAVCAREGVMGIIPGSQGTCSYITEGLGCRESFNSCSHGAGRLMSRKQACRTLDLKEQVKMMDDKGIIHSVSCNSNLDEAPGAYKDIDDVMEQQKDLVKIMHKLTPFAVIKG